MGQVGELSDCEELRARGRQWLDLKGVSEFRFYPKGNRDSLKNFEQGFNMIQFVIYQGHSGNRVEYIPVSGTFLNIMLSFNPQDNCPAR